MKKITEAEALHRMAAYCSGAERCIQEIEKKLNNFELSDEEKQSVLNRLIKEKFIDEKRYVKSFINDKLRFNKWGRVKLSYELQKKNIPASIRSEALNEINEDEYRNILHQILKEKNRTIKAKDNYEKFNKLLRFAAGRGFETQEIISCLKTIMNGDEYVDDLE